MNRMMRKGLCLCLVLVILAALLSVPAFAAELTVSISADKSSAAAGEEITWTAAATGGTGALRYCFYVYRNGNTVWKGTYGSEPSCSYTPAAAGTYTAKVFVMDGAKKRADRMSAGVTVTAAPLTVTGITADKAYITKGDQITWTAAATGGTGTLRYCFYVYRNGSTVWKGTYGSEASCSYTAAAAGTYTAKVFVMDGAKKKADQMSEATVAYEPLVITNFIGLDPLVPEGSTISWLAEVTGGSGSLKYNFYIYQYGREEPVKKTGWIASDIGSYANAEIGDYYAKVWVKDYRTGVTVSEMDSNYSTVESAEYYD